MAECLRAADRLGLSEAALNLHRALLVLDGAHPALRDGLEDAGIPDECLDALSAGPGQSAV